MELQPRTRNGDATTKLWRVVVVDDEADIRVMMRVILRTDGRFDVVGEASDGREGVNAVAALRPDVVVLDLSMPVMDGLTALPLIKEIDPHCGVVVCSAYLESKTGLSAAGADAYVDKLEVPVRLADVLEQVCSGHQPASIEPRCR